MRTDFTDYIDDSQSDLEGQEKWHRDVGRDGGWSLGSKGNLFGTMLVFL